MKGNHVNKNSYGKPPPLRIGKKFQTLGESMNRKKRELALVQYNCNVNFAYLTKPQDN